MVLNEKHPRQVFLSSGAVGQLTYAQHQSKWRDVAKLSEGIRLKADLLSPDSHGWQT